MSNSASSFTGVSSGYTAGTPVPADSPIRDNIADAVRRVRETTPLAQSFTNFVTINLVAKDVYKRQTHYLASASGSDCRDSSDCSMRSLCENGSPIRIRITRTTPATTR